MTTFASAGNEFKSELTSLRMLGRALMLLRGLITLKVRRTFKFGRDGMNSIPLKYENHNKPYPIITAMKSIQFHASLR